MGYQEDVHDFHLSLLGKMQASVLANLPAYVVIPKIHFFFSVFFFQLFYILLMSSLSSAGEFSYLEGEREAVCVSMRAFQVRDVRWQRPAI